VGDKVLVDLVAGWRPTMPEYLKPDMVWLLELNGEYGRRGSLDGVSLVNDGGTELFLSPVDVAVNAAGLVYVVDQYHHRIQYFDKKGDYLAAWGGKGDILGRFNGPTGVAIASDNSILVADWGNHRIQKFSAQ
jgi:DNA-binding beta-propeller fold protein YncE